MLWNDCKINVNKIIIILICFIDLFGYTGS